MFTQEDLNGTIIKSYVACKRQGWLASRKLSPLATNVYIQMGTALSELRKTERRRFGNIELDEIVKGKSIVVKEYKKSFSNIESSEMQLLFYMLNLKNEMKLKKIEGYIISEETSEKKHIPFNKKEEDKILTLTSQIIKDLNKEKPPIFQKIPLCLYCGHNIYCL